MFTGKVDDSTNFVNLPVYGPDPASLYSVSADTSPTVIMPVFGVKDSDNAFAAIIEDGDALAEIQARRASALSPARVSASFVLRSQNKLDKKSYISEQYDGNIKICYRFISGKSANYSGMARAARELIRGRALHKEGKLHRQVPLNLSVIGAARRKRLYQSLTKIDQAQDLAEILKGKGMTASICAILDFVRRHCSARLRKASVLKTLAENPLSRDSAPILKDKSRVLH